MKTSNNQTEPSAPQKAPKMQYQPDRHYVVVQAPDSTWDGDQLDRLLDLTDPATGEAAYTLEANGANATERRITGDRRKVLLSCSKEYIDRVQTENSNASVEQARQVQTGARTRSRTIEGRHVPTIEDETFGTKATQNVLPSGLVGI